MQIWYSAIHLHFSKNLFIRPEEERDQSNKWEVGGLIWLAKRLGKGFPVAPAVFTACLCECILCCFKYTPDIQLYLNFPLRSCPFRGSIFWATWEEVSSPPCEFLTFIYSIIHLSNLVFVVVIFSCGHTLFANFSVSSWNQFRNPVSDLEEDRE